MTTPRSPYVVIADSLLTEPWPFDVKGSLVLLSCHMHARWRADRRLSLEDVAERHPVSIPELMLITGKGRRDIALKSLELLAEVASISFEVSGMVVWIRWPKWSIYNRVNSRSPGRSQGGSEAPPKPKPKPKVQDVPGDSSPGDPGPPEAPARRPEPHPEALRIAGEMITMLETVPGAVIARGARSQWARELERLVRECPSLRDAEAPWDRVEAGMWWSLGPENLGREFEVVVRSGGSLRRKWPQLEAAARRRARERQPTRELDQFWAEFAT